jgi:UDP-4-amino-4,6-dideoxy-N-acetyl-beta-L-altrosamine N-acetyltransferase
MRLRLATMDDALDVLAWRNDPVAIAMSKTPGATDQKTHMAWFARAIRDEARVLLIALNRDEKVGLVRFDRTGDAWLVSIREIRAII